MGKMNNEMWHEKKPDIDDKEVERTRQSEKMVKFLSFAKNIPALTDKSVEEVFSTEENKRFFIENVTEADFVDLIKSINALLRGKDMDSSEMEWQNMKVEGGALLFGLADESFSHRKDKAKLYSLLHKAMQEMNQGKRSMGDIALLCGASINAIHGFSDGNGRTSRFVYSMLHNNLDNDLKKDLRGILSTEGNDIIDIKPTYIGYEIDKLVEKEVGIVRKGKNKTILSAIDCNNPDILKEKISEQDFKEFSKSLEKDKDYVLAAILGCFKNSKNIEKYIDPEHKYALNADMLFEDLTKEEMNQLIEKYWELKKRKVEILIDCIAHPEKKEYQIKEGKKKLSMKDYLEESIKNKSKENRDRKESWEREEKENNKKHQEDLEEAIAALERGGNNHIIHDSEALNSLRKIEKQVGELILAESQRADLYNQENDGEKAEKAKEILHKMMTIINKDADVSPESIGVYFDSKKQAILKNYPKYNIAYKILEFLDKSDAFRTKLSASKTGNRPFDISQEELLDDYLTQSIYYVTPNNSSLRIKLYNINTDEEIVQPIMEQIFFYTQGSVEELSDGLVRFNYSVNLDKVMQSPALYTEEVKVKTFEISSPEFDQEIKKQEYTEVALNSPLKTFKKEEKLYIKIPKGYMHHFGHKIDHVERLNEINI